MVNLIVESGSSMTLSAGNSTGPVNVQCGGQLIVNGGVASEVAVQSMGNATVLGGGVMNTINASGGLVNVLSGGLANNTVLTDDANMNVRSAGKANNVNVLDGVLAVSSGGYASGVQISSEGALKMLQGASAVAITVSEGGTAGGFTQINGAATIAAMNGNAIAGTVTGLNATGNISAVKGAVISGGTFASGTIQFAGGAASGLTIANSGVLKANSADVTISNTYITSGGTLLLTGTAVASGITVYAGGTVNNFTHIGNTAATITKMTGNTITGSASNIMFEGTMNVGKGVTLTNITVADGALFLASSAKVESLVISAGSAAIQNGATASGITVCDGAYLRIQAGGAATNVTLANGAKALDFQQVGTSAATIGMINNNGIGGTIANLNATGNVNILTSASATALTAAADGKITLNAGAKANTVSIASAGTLTVQSGATAQNVAVAAGGHLNIVSGGSAVSVDLTNRGYLDMVIGGGDSKTYVTGKNEKGTFSYINGVASNFMVYAGQNLVITSGGSARNLTVAQGGVLSAAMGADITGYSSDMGMSFSIQDGAISGLTNLYNFELGIGHGYAVDGQKLDNGGVQSVASGGLVNRTTINAGGEVRVGYNGSAWDLNQSAGGKISLDVYHAGALTSVTGSRTDSNGTKQIFGLDNGIATNFVISSGAYLNIHSGGSAEKTTVVEGGKLVLSSGGTATKITLEQNAILSANVYGNDSKTIFEATRDSASIYMSNGVANGFVLENGGRLNVRDGGTASNTTIGNNGLLYVDYMGSAANVNIENGGNVYVQNAARIASVDIQDGAQLTLAAGATVKGTVTVAGQLICQGNITFTGTSITIDTAANSSRDAETAFIENISYLQNADYSVRVDNTSSGIYKLATNALNFSCTVNVYDATGTSHLGKFNATDKSFQYGANEYRLTESANGDLTLVIENIEISVKADITAPTQNAVTVTAEFLEDKFTVRKYSLDEGVTWKDYTGAITMSANGTIYFRGENDEGYVAQVSYTVDNIDNEAPAKPTASANEQPTNKNVTVYAAFSSDSVKKEYSYDKKIWQTYTDGAIMQDNGTIYFRGTDDAGNVSEITEYTVANIDKTAPQKPSVKATGSTSSNVTVSATFSDDSVKKEYSYDNKIWQTYTVGIEMNKSGTLYFRGTDAAGNVSDVTEYSVAAAAPGNVKASVSKYTLTLSWDKLSVAKGQKATYEITVNGEVYTSNSNKLVLSKLLPGDYTYQVQGIISEKNQPVDYTALSKSAVVTVNDVTDPKMGKVTAKQVVAHNEPTTITVEWAAATDNNQDKISKYVITCNRQTKEVDGNTFSWTFTNVEGTKAEVAIIAYDMEGNASASKKVNLTIKDMIDPGQVTGVATVSIDKYKGTFTWNEVVEEDFGKVAKYKVKVDGKEFTTSKNSINVSNLSVGWHTIQVLAVDNAKNEGEWSNAIGFEVKDMTAPKMGKVTAKQVVAHNEPTTITVEWAAATDNNQDKISKYVITCNRQTKEVDGNTFSWTFTNVEGTKAEVAIIAYDMEGNASASKKVNLTIKDMIDPGQVTGVATVSIDKYKGTFTWNEVVEEDFGKVAKYKVKVDGKEFTTSKNSVSISNLSVGEHTIYVCAVDKAKNEGEWSEEFTFVVEDVTKPNTVSVQTKVTANDVALTWKKPTDNADSVGQGVTKYILKYGDVNDTTKDSWTTVDTLTGADTSFDIMGLNKGKYKFEMIALDAAGNESKVKTGSFEIKTELPVMNILMDYDSNSIPDLMAWTSSESADSDMLYSAETEYDLLRNNDPVSGSDALCSFASGETENWYDPENRNAGNLAALA